MNDGFIRAAAATPDLRVADPIYNREQICNILEEGQQRGCQLMVFPELCLTGYTCGDLFLQDSLLRSARNELKAVIRATQDKNMLVFVGLPWEHDGKLFNVAAGIADGRLLGLVPKVHLPNYAEFYEARYFTAGYREPVMTFFDGEDIPLGTNLLFRCSTMPELVAAAEICEDVWVLSPPSAAHAGAGATVIANCSASDEIIGKDRYRNTLVTGQSARLMCGYIYANTGEGESTQDLVFGGHNLIVENGNCLAQSRRFANETIYADFDLQRLLNERRKTNTFPAAGQNGYQTVSFTLAPTVLTPLLRNIPPLPFVPADTTERSRRCEDILTMQALGLKKRLSHTGITRAVLGISGGLDSTLALLVTARAFDMLGLPRGQIEAVTMPCFGTTDRTYQNACEMARRLGAALREVDIRGSVLRHFEEIGQSPDNHDVTFENAQARERTQVLMDIANQINGLVVGTGDMSELALGWATYNGDHMSMYAVNASVPKTLVRHLVSYYADTCESKTLSEILADVLDTPVSPELLPPENGRIAQKTEDLVGPYELHDFFLYYVLRCGYRPSKIFRMARQAFGDLYGQDVIHKWLQVFYRRFFTQQFKRSCLPDGPKVGSVAVSPRGDLRMPSDASWRIWLDDLEELGQ